MFKVDAVELSDDVQAGLEQRARPQTLPVRDHPNATEPPQRLPLVSIRHLCTPTCICRPGPDMPGKQIRRL